MSGQEKKGWKRFFVKEDEVEVEETPKASATQEASKVIHAPNPPVQFSSTSGMIDEALIGEFEQALADNNIDGMDYYEYRKAVKDMGAFIPDEPTRYKAAFVSFMASGLTADKMAAQVETHYIPVIENERAQFDTAMDAMMAENVTGVEETIVKLKADNDEKVKMINQLTQEIGLNNEEVAKLQGTLGTNRAKIESRKSSFYATIEKFITELRSDITKINSYLK